MKARNRAAGDDALSGTQDPAAVDMQHLARDPITGGRAQQQ
jgi:hypothetical protein